jgi:hypothetical protein
MYKNILNYVPITNTGAMIYTTKTITTGTSNIFNQTF